MISDNFHESVPHCILLKFSQYFRKAALLFFLSKKAMFQFYIYDELFGEIAILIF